MTPPQASEAAVAWQPIESAPKRQDVLTFTRGMAYPVRIAMLCDSGWLDTACVKLPRKPSHWMPLPEPPALPPAPFKSDDAALQAPTP